MKRKRKKLLSFDIRNTIWRLVEMPVARDYSDLESKIETERKKKEN